MLADLAELSQAFRPQRVIGLRINVVVVMVMVIVIVAMVVGIHYLQSAGPVTEAIA